MLCLRSIATNTSHNQRADKCEAKASAYTFGGNLETWGYLRETARLPSSGPRPPRRRKNDYSVILEPLGQSRHALFAARFGEGQANGARIGGQHAQLLGACDRGVHEVARQHHEMRGE